MLEIKKLTNLFKIVFLTSTFCLTAALRALDLNDYQFISEDYYPPYNFKGSDGLTRGYNSDLLVYLFEKLDLDLTRKDIKIWPWARAYREVLNPDSQSALYSIALTDSRKELFKWVGPLSVANHSIITLKGNPKNISIQSVKDLKEGNFIYGTIRDDFGIQILLENGVDEKNIYLFSSIVSLMKMLQFGRIDAISFSKDVFFWIAKQESYSEFEVIYSKDIGDLYIAFSRDTDDKIITTLQTALDELKNDTELFESFKKPYQSYQKNSPGFLVYD